jgi:hypothetical protein
MLEEKEIRAIAQRIVDMSKSTARRETGYLQRSISYTVERNVYIFKEVFYGQYRKNSMLEKNAIKLMPSGVRWKMRYTDLNNRVIEEGQIRTGRATQKSLLPTLARIGTTAVSNLISKIINRGKKKD